MADGVRRLLPVVPEGLEASSPCACAVYLCSPRPFCASRIVLSLVKFLFFREIPYDTGNFWISADLLLSFDLLTSDNTNEKILKIYLFERVAEREEETASEPEDGRYLSVSVAPCHRCRQSL